MVSHQKRQMSFDLPVYAAMSSEDFMIDETNKRAFEYISKWPSWQNGLVVLAGPIGTGKSHLAKIYQTQASALKLDGNRLPEGEALPDLEKKAVLIEDIHKAQIDQTRLFHLLNYVKEQSSTLLITSRTWPDSWGLELPDLTSRMRAAHPLELNEPSDKLLSQVLVKLFADRQLQVDKRVVDYLLIRMERSLSAAGQIVQILDKASLDRSRPITRQLVAEFL